MGRISDKLEKDLTEHPDAIQVELAGETLPWFIGRRTFGLVERHPDQETTFSDILQRAMEATGEEVDPEKQIEKLARIMWAGFLPFEPELGYDPVADMISFGDLPRLQKVLERNFGKLQELADEADMGKSEGPVPTEEIPEEARAAVNRNRD